MAGFDELLSLLLVDKAAPACAAHCGRESGECPMESACRVADLILGNAPNVRLGFSSAARHIVERDQCTTISSFNAFARSFEARSQTDMSMAEYLDSCRTDPMRYANAAERLLAAIGEPQMIDTAKDPRLGRIFSNRTIRGYPAFAGFCGMEDTIERIVGVLPACGAGPGGAQADPLSARPGRRRQVVARRAARSR